MDVVSYLLGKDAGQEDVKLQNKSVSITENGISNVTADADYDALRNVEITTNVTPTLQNKSVTINQNGTTTVSKDNNYDGINSVEINTNVSPVLQTKSVTITENGETTITYDNNYDGLSSVNVTTSVSGGGGGGFSGTDVTFYDYDGKIVQSYSKSDFLALSEMPSNPTHTGLTSQGWNWSLSDAKTYMATHNKLNIGQMYTTSDGTTKINIKLTDGRLSPYLGFAINGTATVDWGDNSSTDTVTGTRTNQPVFTLHEYAEEGEYTISISSEVTIHILGSTNGSYLLKATNSTAIDNRDNAYRNHIISINSSSKTNFASNGLRYCKSLLTISMESSLYINNACLYESGLQFIVIPTGSTGVSQYCFQNCYSLSNTILPNTIQSLGEYSFSYCYALSNLTLPNTITSMSSYIFEKCYSLENIVLPSNVPNLNTNCFKECTSLKNVTLPSNLVKINSSAFSNCKSLSNITIPNTVTTMGNSCFSGCSSLSNVTLPNAISALGHNCFDSNPTLTHVVFPSTITNIGASAFYYCYGMGYYDFSNLSAVPSLGDSAVFSGIQSDCKIIVPDSLYEEWIATSNWSTYANNIIKKSDWDAL